ncbi:Copper transport outer membrane protein, MctB [Frankineae bacterium MT45]|nr:Copper transport outer membrane protein, MctB [Frankineae bacterium MT45]
MINFRFHLISLVAIFLALALGIVVGTTALNGPITTDLRTQVNSVKADRAALAEQVKTLQAQVGDTDKFASLFAAQVVAKTLTDQKVLILGLPGARTDIKDAVAKGVIAAGGTVSGRIQLTPDYSDPKRANDLQALVTSGIQPTGATLPPSADPGVVSGALLSYVLLGKGQATDLQQVLTGYASLHMLRDESSTTVAPSQLIAVVASGNLAGQNDVAQTQLDLIDQLRQAGAHQVVVGDSPTAKPGGIIARILANDTLKSGVSTVDNGDTSLGQVSATLALSGAAKSQVGHYGTGPNVDGLFPEG